MIRTIANGLARVVRAGLDPTWDPDAEAQVKLQAEYRAALLLLAVELIRAQRVREDDR